MKAKFVLSRSKVLEQLKNLEEISDLVSYSFKTNYEVGKVLEENSNCMFSVHSIEALKKLNDKKRAIFFLQAQSKEEIKEILDLKVKSFVVDNEKDLNNLLEMADKINLFLRMKLKENTIHTGKHFVFGFRSSKVNELVKELRTNEKIEKLGVHFHRKTQNVSEWGLKDELDVSLDNETLEKLDLINIGGGIPYIYKNYSEQVLKSVFDKLKDFKNYLNSKNIQVIVEPGRYIAAPSVKLITEIKNIYDNNIIVNCSIYNSAMDTFIAHIRLLVENELEKGNPYVIKGCTPDSLDIFRYRVYLDNPKIGDKVIFLNAGAYNFNCDFCQLPKLQTEVIE
ncbi:MAG: decarboxylase [Nanoarchaeota archaeon]|nr:decarboxylase [Nanoarchaeota archaeon]MBU4242451.1 decarboxylase [Nanoarchaeota archaeon]MBU4352697.1 decarboxylase [Nanoarchaeota archaeon]MBU4456485.1 decarboxylase [Nanoarchaeota archaeon]MCG2720359.1 decarboxylase [Nanoarchaeota archaeon]